MPDVVLAGAGSLGVGPSGRPVRINCVLGNQFKSSQLHHALCSQRVSCTLCQTARRFKDFSAAVSEALRLWLCARARFPRLSTARLRLLETVSRRRMQRPVRERQNPVRAKAMTDHGNAAILRWGERD